MIWFLLFYISMIVVLYIYVGYPLIIGILAIFRSKPARKSNDTPSVSILIAAYNEETCIESTIKNKLELDYPMERMEIIVVSDGSEDRTDEIVDRYADQGVKLLRQEPRAGKTSALNMAVSQAKNDILVFSDANSWYEPQALRKLVSNFADPDVGYVTGKMVYTNADGTLVGDGCSAYMKYENFLRSMETRVGSVIGVDGGIDAVRKTAYRNMNPDQLPDFVLPLKVAEQGYRIVYEPEATLKEESLNTTSDEYKMRVRVTLRAYWALFDMRQLLFNTSQSLFVWQLWSHKVLRYLCFIFLICLYFSNLMLVPKGWFFTLFFLLQNISYLTAALYPRFERTVSRVVLFRLMNYFTVINLAALHAFMKFLTGQKQVFWTPRKG